MFYMGFAFFLAVGVKRTQNTEGSCVIPQQITAFNLNHLREGQRIDQADYYRKQKKEYTKNYLSFMLF